MNCSLVLDGGVGRLHLGFDGDFGGEEAFILVLGRVGAVDNVFDKLGAEGQGHGVAIDVAGLLVIDDEEVVALVADGDVGVLAGFDVALGA